MSTRQPFFRMLVFFAGIAGATAAWAQSTEVPQLDVEFTVMSTERGKDLAYVQLKPDARHKVRPVAADFAIVPLRVNSQGRSDVYRFQGPAPIRFVRTSGQDKTLKVEKVVGTWSGPSWPDRSLVVLIPQASETLAVHAFDDGIRSHGPRQVRMLNLSGTPIAGVVGATPYRVSAAIAMSAPWAAAGSTKIGVSFARFGKPVVAFDQSVNVGANERLLLVFLPPFRAGADVRTRVVRDKVRVPVPVE